MTEYSTEVSETLDYLAGIELDITCTPNVWAEVEHTPAVERAVIAATLTAQAAIRYAARATGQTPLEVIAGIRENTAIQA